jgi:hypothetical protein
MTLRQAPANGVVVGQQVVEIVGDDLSLIVGIAGHEGQ